MDFSAIGELGVGRVKQYIVHRNYAFPNTSIQDLKDAMAKSTAEETLLLVEVGQECEKIRDALVTEKNVLPVDAAAVIPVFVIASSVRRIFVANVEMHVEITITVRRDQ